VSAKTKEAADFGDHERNVVLTNDNIGNSADALITIVPNRLPPQLSRTVTSLDLHAYPRRPARCAINFRLNSLGTARKLSTKLTGMREVLTKAALAKELEVTRGRISQLIGQGMPVRPDGRIDLLGRLPLDRG
jgi:hypothetical protein